MEKKNRGRPEKYSYEKLKQILLEYAADYPGKITPSQLAEKTGINRHVWMRRMSKEIEQINRPLIGSNNNVDPLPLPNIEAIIERYGDNKKQLITSLQHVNDVIQSLYSQNLDSQKKISALQEEITKYKEQIRELKVTLNHYEDIVAGSVYQQNRKRNSIQQNLLSINPTNKEVAASLDFEKMFPKLFE